MISMRPLSRGFAVIAALFFAENLEGALSGKIEAVSAEAPLGGAQPGGEFKDGALDPINLISALSQSSDPVLPTALLSPSLDNTAAVIDVVIAAGGEISQREEELISLLGSVEYEELISSAKRLQRTAADHPHSALARQLRQIKENLSGGDIDRLFDNINPKKPGTNLIDAPGAVAVGDLPFVSKKPLAVLRKGPLRVSVEELGRQLAELPRAERAPAVKALAELWGSGRPKDAEAVGELARGLAGKGFLPSVKDLFEQIAEPAVSGRGRESEITLSGRPLWGRGAQGEISRRMPTLNKILADPANTASFLSALSFLRMAFAYDAGMASPYGALAYGRRTGIEFQLGELRIFPVSESFRRHVISVTDAQGTFAVELKMPGQMPERRAVDKSHFTVAAEMAREFREDPGTVLPLYFQQYLGRASLYGQPVGFGVEQPLALMLFSYSEGKRLRNSLEFVEEIARESELSVEDVQLGAEAAAAAAAIKLHFLGWSGDRPYGGDMHWENVRVLSDGGAVLVGDYGAFEKAVLSPAQRASETTALIGRNPRRDRAWLKRLEPLVVERLSRGVKDPEKLGRIRAEVGVELGLR